MGPVGRIKQDVVFRRSTPGGQGLRKPLSCVPTDELLRAKDDLLSEPGQSLSSLTAAIVNNLIPFEFYIC